MKRRSFTLTFLLVLGLLVTLAYPALAEPRCGGFEGPRGPFALVSPRDFKKLDLSQEQRQWIRDILHDSNWEKRASEMRETCWRLHEEIRHGGVVDPSLKNLAVREMTSVIENGQKNLSRIYSILNHKQRIQLEEILDRRGEKDHFQGDVLWGEDHEGRRELFIDRLAERLDLSPEQKAKVQAILDRRWEATRADRMQLFSLFREMKRFCLTEYPNYEALSNLANRSARLMVEQMISREKALFEIESVLDPAQRHWLNEMCRPPMMMWNGEDRHGMPHPHEGEGPAEEE